MSSLSSKIILSGWFVLTTTALADSKLPISWLSPTAEEANTTQDSPMPQEAVASLLKLTQAHENIAEKYHRSPRPGWRFKELHLEVGISAEGTFGLNAVGGQAAMEMIWSPTSTPQNLVGQSPDEEVVDLHSAMLFPHSTTDKSLTQQSTQNAENMYETLKQSIEASLDQTQKKRFLNRRVLRLLRREAEKIGPLVETLRRIPAVGHWSIDGFQKIFTFSASGDLLDQVEVGYDKRIRFRFSLSPVPFSVPKPQANVADNDSSGTPFENWLYGQMWLLNHLSQIEISEKKSSYELQRVWQRIDVISERDFKILTLSSGIGFLVSFRKQSPRTLVTGSDFESWAYAPQHLLHALEKWPLQQAHRLSQFLLAPLTYLSQSQRSVELSQVQTKFTVNANREFKLATLEGQAVLECHYFLRK